MKRSILTICLSLLVGLVLAQSPLLINYQGVARDNASNPLQNQNISLRLTLHQGSPTGSAAYQELHLTSTNGLGLFTLQIGNGIVLSGSMATVDWSLGPYYLQTELDANGGSNFSDMGTSQLVSTPYALYAETSGNGGTGPTGPTGPPGPQGSAGMDGAQGPAGADGAAGPQGPQGPTGNDGPQGIQGIAGPQGPTGNDGAQGPAGPTGPTGPLGAASGDLIGNYPAPNVVGLQGYGVSSTIPQTGNVLTWNGVLWTPTAPTQGIIVIDQANHTSVNVSDNNIVRIDGTITLSGNYNALNSDKLLIEGGTIQGNGSQLTVGNNVTFVGTTFSNVDIASSSSGLKFINCVFQNNCPRLGFYASFDHCTMYSLTLSSVYALGSVVNCELSNCTIPRVREFLQCELQACEIGNGSLNARMINTISNSRVYNSYIYALQSDFIFSGNNCSGTKIKIGASDGISSTVSITGNYFDDVLSGQNEVIEVYPIATWYKVLTIQGNQFLLQSGTPRSIHVSSNDGNTFGLGVLNVQNNTFVKGNATLSYSSNMRVNYSNNISLQLNGSHPSSTGNLGSYNNYSY